MVKVPGRGQRPPILITLKTRPVRALSVDPQPEEVNGAGSGSSVGLQRDAGIGAGARPCRRSGGGREFGQRPRRHFDGLFGQAKVDVDAFADHFDKFGQHPAPEAKAYAIRENDGASLSMGHFKQTETLLPLLVIRRPIAAMIVADETDGLVVADDAPRQDTGIGRTSVGLGGRR